MWTISIIYIIFSPILLFMHVSGTAIVSLSTGKPSSFPTPHSNLSLITVIAQSSKLLTSPLFTCQAAHTPHPSSLAFPSKHLPLVPLPPLLIHLSGLAVTPTPTIHPPAAIDLLRGTTTRTSTITDAAFHHLHPSTPLRNSRHEEVEEWEGRNGAGRGGMSVVCGFSEQCKGGRCLRYRWK